jgi:hypothetical protein
VVFYCTKSSLIMSLDQHQIAIKGSEPPFLFSFFWLLEIGSSNEAQSGLELMILLPQPPMNRY